MANDPHSILWIGKNPVAPFVAKNNLKQRKPERYRAGKVPKWCEANDEEQVESRGLVANAEKQHSRFARLQRTMQNERHIPGEKRRHVTDDGAEPASPSGSARPAVEAAILDGASSGSERRAVDAILDDAESLSWSGDDIIVEELRPTITDETKCVQEAIDDDPTDYMIEEEWVPGIEAKVDVEEEERFAARQRAREHALVKRKQEEKALQAQESESTESESESESSESEDPFGGVMLKPVFVPKGQRTTDEQKRQKFEQEERLAREKRLQEKIRKEDAKILLAESLRREEEQKVEKEAALSEAEMPDDDDVDEAEEYELWRKRELRRLKRTVIERKKMADEAAEIERRRNMTDAERAEDDRRLAALNPAKEKGSKYAFLQKYYHKGAYFMDRAADGSEELYNRDVNQPLAEEKTDRSALPKVMQMRRGYWGKKGQVKHKHLGDADTTDMNSAWVREATRLKEKLAAQKPTSHQFDHPSAR